MPLLLLTLSAACMHPLEQSANVTIKKDVRKSGAEFMSAQNQALQHDDNANPAMLWVKDGEAQWSRKTGAADKSCADCHAAPQSMRGVAVRYPAFDETTRAPINLQQRIEICRAKHQRAAPLAFESQPLLNLESYVALQSRGMPLMPPADVRLDTARTNGKARYVQRIGQLDLACTHCHDRHAGGKLGGSTIPEAHPTAYPLYRLEWQALGSLQRRLRNCMTGVRAEPYALGSAELVGLELYLHERAAGMTSEAPGVRP